MPSLHRGSPRFVRRRLWYEVLRRWAGDRLDAHRVIRFDRNLRMGIRITDPVDRAIYLHGIFEPRAASVFVSLLRPGMRVLDAGAHDGQYALLAAKRVGREGKVLAVEPDPDVRRRLVANISLNGFSNITVISSALADGGGGAVLFIPVNPELGGQASLKSGWSGQSRVRSIAVVKEPLDALLRRLRWDRLDVIKLDVEGFEAEVLSGGRESIADYRPAIMFEVNGISRDNGVIRAPTIDALYELGYLVHGIASDASGEWRLHELSRGADPTLYREPWFALNLIALHPRSIMATATAAGSSRP